LAATALVTQFLETFKDSPPRRGRELYDRPGNGDVQMLHFTGGTSQPALRLRLAHDDADREFDYRAGAELALERAREHGWTMVSIKDDWITVFGEGTSR
jgi:hypothetical protein